MHGRAVCARGENGEEGSATVRYVAIRIRNPQGELFEDGSAVRHFAVLSNRWELKPARLIEWHREKAGTIELVHDVIKNDLGGRGAALEILGRQRRVAASGGDRPQRAPGAEAAGPARRTARPPAPNACASCSSICRGGWCTTPEGSSCAWPPWASGRPPMGRACACCS